MKSLPIPALRRASLRACGPRSALLLLAMPSLALAEGTAQWGATQRLIPDTDIRVDILDSATETFVWNGAHPVEVRSPTNTAMGTFTTGQTITPTAGNGAYYVLPQPGDYNNDNQINSLDYETNWDLAVSGATSGRGRIWSYAWQIDAGSFNATNSFNGSVYTVVDGGDPNHDGVVEMKTDGLAGFVFLLAADDLGVPGANGRSVDQAGNISVKYRIYLNPPEDATYNPLQPQITNESFTGGALGCDGVSPGLVNGRFDFTSNVEGTYHIVCDINNDGEFDVTSDNDVHLLGSADIGANSATWGGTTNTGQPVPPGTYDCQILLTVGEFHYVAADIETSYDGFRLFDVSASLQRTGLNMYWNDTAVQAKELQNMANGELPIENPGPDGLYSGAYTDAAVANDNARSWGNFTDKTKGNQSYLDTYTWIYQDASTIIPVRVYDPALDTDHDRLPDAAEDCTWGTIWNDPDTDHDGLTDGDEVLDLPTDPFDPDSDHDGLLDGDETDASDPVDTDGDGLIDSVDPDDDGDGHPTTAELPNGDTDGDGTDDYLDDDDDGDHVPSLDEGGDTDGDGTENYLDDDDDDDGVLTADEDYAADVQTSGNLNGDGDPTNDDFDHDGIADYIDTDDDGDGIDTEDEDANGNGDPGDDNADGDPWPDYLDLDADGDGIPDVTEGADDTDGDGDPDYLDTDSDGDTLLDELEGTTDSDGDGDGDWVDPDDDDDGIPTAEEVEDGVTDFDGDERPDYLDDDDDGDGIPTETEGGFDTDTDNDGTSDHLDLDSDDDTLLDELEGSADTDGDGDGDWRDTDADNDGWLDEEEGTTDSDGDFAGDWRDADDDGDTVPTADEGREDTDGDGTVDRLDTDDDDDGIPTAHENDAAWDDDVDGDGTPNWRDLDSDADGIDDAVELEDDFDGDGIPDYLDPDGTYDVWYRGGCKGMDSSGGSGGAVIAALAFLGILARRRR